MSSGPNQQIVGIVGVVAVILIIGLVIVGTADDFFGTRQDQVEASSLPPFSDTTLGSVRSDTAGTDVLAAGEIAAQNAAQQVGQQDSGDGLDFRDAPTPGDIQDGFFIDNDGNVTQRYIDSTTGREYFVYTAASGGGSSADDGSACEQAANCTLLNDPGNAGTSDLDPNVTTITFTAGQEEFDVPIPASGETDCTEGYCVTHNGDGTISWSSDEAVADITLLQFWAGDRPVATESAGDTSEPRLNFCHIAVQGESPANTTIYEDVALDALDEHFLSDGSPNAGHELDFLIEPIPDGLQGYPIDTSDHCVNELPSLTIDGGCLSNGGVTFRVRNNGPDMAEGQSYLIIDADANELKAGTFTLKAGQLTTIALVGSGQGVIYTFTTSGSAGTAETTHDCTAGPVPLFVTQAMCEGGQSRFTITNDGDSMPAPQSYIIEGPDGILLEGEFDLGSDDTITIPVTGGQVNVLYIFSSDGLEASSICEAPAVEIEPQCQDGAAAFILTNNGSAMTDPQAYTITGPDDLLLEGQFDLGAGNTVTIPVTNGQANVSYIFTSDGSAGTFQTSHLCEAPVIVAEPQCQDGAAAFILTNNGAEMSDPQAYSITGPDGFLLEDQFQLGTDETATIPVTGGQANVTYIFSSESVEMSHFCEAPAVEVEPLCEDGVPAFILTNNGSAMTDPQAYSITGPDGILLEGQFELDAGETMTIPVTDGQANVNYTFTSEGSVGSLQTNTICEASVVQIEPQCQDGAAAFILTNSGAAMTMPQTYSITGPNDFLLESQFQLGADETVTIPVAGGQSGLNYTFISDGAAGTLEMSSSCLTISPDHLCGFVNPIPGGGAGPGFPIINMEGQTCVPDVEQAHPNWIPVVVSEQNVCPDWLLYHTNQTGDWEIFRLGELSGRPEADPNISRGVGPTVFDIAPARSPDAEWITFASTRDGNWEIYVAALDGSFQQRVTINGQAIDLDPVWSPDGSRIVYESNVNRNWELWIVDLVTGEKSALTDHPANDINAAWSPDSSKIVFQSDREGGLWQIYELDLATGNVTRLSDGAGGDHDPQYSNSGTQIAFRSTRDGGQSTIYTMNADGTGLMQVSESGGNATNHVWSSNDDLIAYQSDLVNGVNDIYVYQVSTGMTRLITANQGEPYAGVQDSAPTWYCDSTTLAFTSAIAGDNNIYSYPALPMDADPIQVDRSATQLTDHPANDRDPVNAPSEENASRGGALPPQFSG
jgi:TolB protein